MIGFYISAGLLTAKHRKSIGPALWEFEWLISHETRKNGEVLDGAPIPLNRICKELGQHKNSTKQNLNRLESNGYIERKRVHPRGTAYSYVVRNSKKWKNWKSTTITENCDGPPSPTITENCDGPPSQTGTENCLSPPQQSGTENCPTVVQKTVSGGTENCPTYKYKEFVDSRHSRQKKETPPTPPLNSDLKHSQEAPKKPGGHVSHSLQKISDPVLPEVIPPQQNNSALARELGSQLDLVITTGMVRTIEAAIQCAAKKYSLPADAAVTRLFYAAQAARKRGQQVNQLWFLNADGWEGEDQSNGRHRSGSLNAQLRRDVNNFNAIAEYFGPEVAIAVELDSQRPPARPATSDIPTVDAEIKKLH